MKFHNKICLKPISFEEAAKNAANAPKARSLDELISAFQAQNQTQPQVKTASSEKEIKEAAKIEAPVVPAPVVASKEEKEEDIVVEEFKEKEPGQPFYEKKDEKDEKDEKKAATKVQLKVAKKLDFTQWKAEDVVKAWGQHGSVEACMKNVKDNVSDAKIYCGLLQVANNEAATLMKTASAANKKQASKGGQFIKISKLDESTKSWLKEYYTKIYGEDYVNSLLEDY